MRGRRRLLATLAVAILGGCALAVPPRRVPLDTLHFAAPCPARALVVLLPGIYMRTQEFVDNGFVDAVRARGLAVDVVVADAHRGYYDDGSVLRRLRDDVVLPARARGVRSIWLAGISLGGMGALAYGAKAPDDIGGVVALAPYLGEPELLREMEVAGGPAAWRAAHVHAADDDWPRLAWEWLSAPTPVPVWIGHGHSDRFADAHRVAAGVLPPGHVFDVPGGHDWDAWRPLWSAWLDRGLLPACPR